MLLLVAVCGGYESGRKQQQTIYPEDSTNRKYDQVQFTHEPVGLAVLFVCLSVVIEKVPRIELRSKSKLNDTVVTETQPIRSARRPGTMSIDAMSWPQASLPSMLLYFVLL